MRKFLLNHPRVGLCVKYGLTWTISLIVALYTVVLTGQNWWITGFAFLATFGFMEISFVALVFSKRAAIEAVASLPRDVVEGMRATPNAQASYGSDVYPVDPAHPGYWSYGAGEQDIRDWSSHK